MSDPMVPAPGAKPTPPASDHTELREDRPAAERDAVHRLTSRLASLDLDPATLEMLTAVLNADLDPRPSDVASGADQPHLVTAT